MNSKGKGSEMSDIIESNLWFTPTEDIEPGYYWCRTGNGSEFPVKVEKGFIAMIGTRGQVRVKDFAHWQFKKIEKP